MILQRVRADVGVSLETLGMDGTCLDDGSPVCPRHRALTRDTPFLRLAKENENRGWR